jgi:hypothetical protein
MTPYTGVSMHGPHHPYAWLRSRFVVSAIALVLAGCDRDDDDQMHGDEHDSGAQDPCDDPRIDDFAIGTTVEGDAIRIAILDATPSAPFRGDNAWTVSLTDRAGAALEHVAVEVQPWMPDHGHGTSVGAEVTQRDDGELHIEPINLWMAGLWEVRFLVTLEDDVVDTAVLTVCVD